MVRLLDVNRYAVRCTVCNRHTESSDKTHTQWFVCDSCEGEGYTQPYIVSAELEPGALEKDSPWTRPSSDS